MTIPEPDFLTVAEVAQIIRASDMTVYRLIDAGTLPAYRFGKRGFVRIDRADLYKYLRQSRSGR